MKSAGGVCSRLRCDLGRAVTCRASAGGDGERPGEGELPTLAFFPWLQTSSGFGVGDFELKPRVAIRQRPRMRCSRLRAVQPVFGLACRSLYSRTFASNSRSSTSGINAGSPGSRSTPSPRTRRSALARCRRRASRRPCPRGPCPRPGRRRWDRPGRAPGRTWR